jgi:hypothetical protein
MAGKNKNTAVKKEAKTRKNFRFGSQVCNVLSKRSKELRMTETDLVTYAIIALLGDAGKFICCPKCKIYVGFKVDLNTFEEHQGIVCHRCNSQLIIDTKTYKILNIGPKKPLKKGRTSACK